MPKELRINGSLRDGAAIDRNELTMFSGAEGMYDFGKRLLATTTFPRDKYRHVGGCNLDSHFNRMVKQGSISNDPKPLFYTLNFAVRDGHPYTIFPISVAPVQPSINTLT